MKLIPYERITIRTPLRPEEALQQLEAKVEPRRFSIGRGQREKPYQGNIDGFHFNISRIIHYRNSFLPVIEGEIQPDIGGSSILITMHLHPVVMAFMGVWFGGVIFALLGSFVSIISTTPQTGIWQPVSLEVFLIPAAMLVFGYLMVLGGFKFESSNSKSFLRYVFRAEQLEE